MTRVDIAPEMIRWARERAGLELTALAGKFPQVAAWELGEKRPTLRQLESYARATRTPIGYLFFSKPLIEEIPIPDFRTMADQPLVRPSPDLLETIYLCQQRQEWYRDWALVNGEPAIELVGAGSVEDNIVHTSGRLRALLGLDSETRRMQPTWTEALRLLIGRADAAGIIVNVSGVVGSNNRRKLSPDEFRGFALVDPHAPLVFINGADTKAAQMFTLAHEIAHIWIGQSALSDSGVAIAPRHAVERWCNKVAAEFLVPLEEFAAQLDPEPELRDGFRVELDRLARWFKVSTLVVLRRMHDVGALAADAYWEAYEEELARLKSMTRSSGGNFYLTLGSRTGKRFARAVMASTLESQTSYTDAFYLLGFRKMSTFRELESSFGLRG